MQSIRRSMLRLTLAMVLPLAAFAQADEAMYEGEIDLEPIDFSNFPTMTSPSDLAVMLLVPTEIEEPIYIDHDGDYRPLHLRTNNLSSRHYYDGPSPLTFFKEGVDEAGKPIFVPVAAAAFDAETKDAIVYLKKQGQQYGAALVDIGLDSQALGTARFINLTPANLAVLLNGDRATLEPGEGMTTSFDTEKKTYFKFKVAARYDEEAKLIFSQRHPFRGEMRMLFIGYSAKPQSGEERPFRVYTHRDAGPLPRAGR